MLVEKEPTELLPRAEDLAAPVTPPAVVASGQVKQLQGPPQSPLEPVAALRFPSRDGAIDLAPHMSELLGEGQPLPPPLGKARMSRHPVTSSRHEGGDDLTNELPARP